MPTDTPVPVKEVVSPTKTVKEKPKPPAATDPRPVKGVNLLEKLPNPFRPSHLTAFIKDYARQHKIDPNSVDRFRFLKAHGLPNPKRRIRVVAITTEGESEPAEYEADDPLDATNQYLGEHKVKAVDKTRFAHTVMAE